MHAGERDERSEWAELMPEFGPDTQILEGPASRALLAAKLSDREQEYYARLAELEEDAGAVISVDGASATGEEAARIGRELLLAATEDAARIADTGDAVIIQVGRTKL